MTRHIEPYRYEVQHSDDADFVAYQRKSSDGVWQTISVWMIPQPARSLSAGQPLTGHSGLSADASASLEYPTSECVGMKLTTLYSVQCFTCTE